METTKLSSKGQVVIPKSLRAAHRWEAGAEFVVEDTPQGVLLRPKSHFEPTDLVQGLGCAGYAGPALSLEEMEQAVGAELRRRWRKP